MEEKVPSKVLQTIIEDVMGFVNSVCKHLKFVAVDNNKKLFVFVPPLQSNASGLKFEHFSGWGLEVLEKPDVA